MSPDPNPRDPRLPPSSDDPGSLRRGNFTYFPVIPGRLEFAIEVRRAILRLRPPIVAVELPGSLEDVYLQLIDPDAKAGTA